MYHQTVSLERLEELAKVSVMGSMVHTADQHVVHEGKRSLHPRNGVVHVALKRSPRIPQTKGQPLVFEQPKGSSDGRLGYISRVDRDLVITFPEVNFGENRAPGCLSRKIHHVRQRVHIRLGNHIEAPKISTRAPATILLLDHVQRAGPRRGRPLDDAVGLQLSEFRLRGLQLLSIKPAKFRGDGRPSGHNMVYHLVVYLWQSLGHIHNSGEVVQDGFVT
jgi:hypothetical protein